MTLQEWQIKHHVSDEAMHELNHLFDPSAPRQYALPAVSEQATQQEIRVAAFKHGRTLWRNNSGATMDDNGNMIRYGLGNDSSRLNKVWKSSDLIGITPVMSTCAGQKFGVFTAIECKRPGWTGVRTKHEKAHNAFLMSVALNGGIAKFATSVEDYSK
jgi:hypothetical protein